MPREALIYDILLSCPSDVTDLKDIVKECIEDFNRIYGSINNVKLELKHWSSDAFPQSGKSAQELLNTQFIHNCDACIALLGNRFGSPTDKYDSGTEEEIEYMISSKKQVFMYFIERKVDPSTIDFEQYSKVLEFKKKYSNDSKGIYCIIKDNNELKKQLTNHLGLYFLQLVTNSQPYSSTNNLPKLTIEIDKDNINNFIDLNTPKLLSPIEEDIKKHIDLINNINIPSIKIKNTKESNSNLDKNLPITTNNKTNNLDFGKLFNIEYKEVKIDNKVKENIIKYCSKKDIILKNDFWNLGSLKKSNNLSIVTPIHSSSEKLEGTDNEKEKYKLISKLEYYICKYNDYMKYFSIISSYNSFNFYVKNAGTTFDEDIDISLIIPKQCLIKNNEIPIPGIISIKYINEYNLVDKIFCVSPNANIDKYIDYPHPKLYQPSLHIPQYNKSLSEEYKEEKETYLNDINKRFCYKYYESEDKDKDIVKFNISYLKQNKSMYFPSILFFKNKPDYIEYQITSKHYPEVINGKLEL